MSGSDPSTLRAWLLGLLGAEEAFGVEMAIVSTPTSTQALDEARAALVSAALDGSLSEVESTALSSRLVASEPLNAAMGRAIRTRLLAQEPITPSHRSIELQVSAEVGALCLAVRDGELSEADEQAFVRWMASTAWLEGLVEWVRGLRPHPEARKASPTITSSPPSSRPSESSNRPPIDLDETPSDGVTADWVRRDREPS